jgi:hypothetical protein
MSVPTIPEPRRIPVSRTTRWTRHAESARVVFLFTSPVSISGSAFPRSCISSRLRRSACYSDPPIRRRTTPVEIQ